MAISSFDWYMKIYIYYLVALAYLVRVAVIHFVVGKYIS